MQIVKHKYLFLLIFLCSFDVHAVDTILLNGKIVTVDDRFTIVQALAIKNQRVFATGSNADIRKLADSGTQMIDLNGRTVIPGLIDSHAHWVRAAEHDELRFDGVTSRAQALQSLASRVRTSRPGEWVSVLGGWSEEQFTDDPRGFPLAELDNIAPDTPVALQSVYQHTWLNSAGLRAAKIDDSTPNPPNGTIEKDASGKLTGLVRGAGGVAFVAAKIPKLHDEARMANTRKLVTYLNSHVEMHGPIQQFIAAYEEMSKTAPIKGLRWSFSHLDQVDEQQLQRMKRLGMTAQIHSRPLIQGVLMHKVHGDAAWDMPPFRRVQDSGIVWGLGSDATAVTTSNPFYTLGFAVTGKMVGGHHVNRQSITREEALIAHTRNNAFILFQEANLGSLQKGKYADLLVLDRDYLTVPADAIKDLKPVMTMVGGRVVFGGP